MAQRAPRKLTRFVLAFVAALALGAHSQAQAPTVHRGEDVDILDVEAPSLIVADKIFEISATIENKLQREVTVNLAATFYNWSRAKNFPCGNQGSSYYRGSTTNFIASVTLRPGETKTYPDDFPTAGPWRHRALADWFSPGSAVYEICVIAVQPGLGSVAPVYEDLHNVTLAGRDANAAPEADFAFDPIRGNATYPVSFVASATDADGDRLGYAWDFGHFGAAGRAVGAGARVSHAFFPAGEYLVNLSVTDGFDTTLVSKRVEILPESVPAVRAPSAARSPSAGPFAFALAVAVAALWARR